MSKDANSRAVPSDTPIPEGPFVLMPTYDGNTNVVAGWYIVDTRDTQRNGIPKQEDFFHVRDEAIAAIAARVPPAATATDAPAAGAVPVQTTLF